MLLDYIDNVMAGEELPKPKLIPEAEADPGPVDQIEILEKQLIVKEYTVVVPGECYGKGIWIGGKRTKSDIYIQRIDEDSDIWTAWRGSFEKRLDGDIYYTTIRSEKNIAENMNILEVLKKAERYLERYIGFIQSEKQ